MEGSPRGLCPLCLISEVAKDESPGTSISAAELEELRAAFPALELVEPLGAGGMGRVFKVRQPHLDRFCALKLLPAGLANDPSWIERFTREARALARLNHPGIVHVYDFGEAAMTSPDGAKKAFPFLLMEYVDGVNLRQALRSGSLSAAEALAVIPPICAALQYAHNQGVLHRDIKPENILLDTEGRVKIADFGLAKLATNPHVPGATLTATGAQLGTAAYMAPEQIESPQDVDHRADIYSLGVVFYELLTGELPLGRFPAPSETAGTDPRLDTIVFRTLEKQRERRFQTAGEVKTEVEHVTNSSPPPMPPLPPASPIPVAAESSPSSKTPRKVVAIVLTCLVVPVVLILLMLALPAGARAGASSDKVMMGIIAVILLIGAAVIIGFTWLFKRLQRAGLSTGFAAAVVASGLILVLPAGCVALFVPAYLAPRWRAVPSVASNVQVTRDSTGSRENEVSAHWKITSQLPLWAVVELRNARRKIQLQPDGSGKFVAEVDAQIIRSFVGDTARVRLELGNGVSKTGGEFSLLAPPPGWLERVFQGASSEEFPAPAKTTLAQIGSDPLLLTISPEPPFSPQDSATCTLKSVSVYEAEGTSMLVIDYVEEIEGDVELYFKTAGMEESPPPTDSVKMVSDRPELWKSRFWRLPAGISETVRKELKAVIESQYLNQPIQMPRGTARQFLQLYLVNGTAISITVGARDGRR